MSLSQSRYYQDEAINSLIEFPWKDDSAPLIVAPTGSGKSHIIAEFMRRALVLYPETNFLIMAHNNEVIVQNAKEAFERCPNIKMTFCSGKVGKRDLSGKAIFATVQSIFRHAYKIPHRIDLCIVDEAHLISDNDNSMYRKFIADMKGINPHMKCIGMTATPFRAKTGYLHKGINRLFTDIAYEIKLLDLIEQGHLTPIITPAMQTKMDISGVKIQGGDYVQGQLEKAIDVDATTKACVSEIIEHGHNRKCWIIFTAGVQHCEHVRDEIRRRGISCEMVVGDTETAERNNIINKHKNGTIRAICAVGVLTTGYNCPAIDLIALMCPTRSPVLYIQMMGRAMRTYPNKENALCCDFGNVVSSLGPIDQVHIAEKRKGVGVAPIKYCPQCKAECHAAAAKCMDCGYQFPERELDIDNTASNAAVLSTQLKTHRHEVSGVFYYRHQKEGRPDSLRVEYLCGPMHSFRQWILLEHFGRFREEGCQWWRSHASTTPPNTVTEALSRKGELKAPVAVHVRRTGKYWEIVKEEL